MVTKKVLSVKNTLQNPDFYLWFLMGLSVVVAIHQYFILPEKELWGAVRPQYNNYLIFKNAFLHLINHQNLYELYPTEYGDYYKYSPTFALFMAPFACLPNWVGLIFWSLINSLVFYFGIRFLPGIDSKSKSFIILFVLFELIGNLQNEQTNSLVAGFILFTFISLEKKQIVLAALFVALGFYLKIYGVIAASLFLLYPGKLKFLGSFIGWMTILFLLPLIVISPVELADQYKSWLDILLSDHNSRYGFSVLGIIHQWFGLNPSKWMVLLIGIVIFCLSYLRIQYYQFLNYRLLFLAAMLCWIILFNHTAESSGYIIAMTGCAIWYVTAKKTSYNKGLIVSTFVIVSLFSTDLMPAHIRHEYIYPYYIRTLPVLLIWTMTLYEICTFKKPTNPL